MMKTPHAEGPMPKALILIIGVLIFVSCLTAQSARADILITGDIGMVGNLSIKDINSTLVVEVLKQSDDSAISGATVNVYNTTTGIRLLTNTTNSSGKTQFHQLSNGSYTVEAIKSGYVSKNATGSASENNETNLTIRLEESELIIIPRVILEGAEVILKARANLFCSVKELEVYQSEKATFTCTFENIGDVALTELSLEIEGFPEFTEEEAEDIILRLKPEAPTAMLSLDEKKMITSEDVFEINPPFIQRIEPKQKKMFFITMKVPEKTPTGSYSLLARAIFREGVALRNIYLIILEVPKKPALRFVIVTKEIEFMKKNIQQLLSEAVFLKSKGADVTEVVELLKIGNASLDKALFYRQRLDLNKMKIQIEVARGFIKQAAEKLALIKLPGITRIQIIIFITIVAFILAITLAVNLREHKKKASKRLTKILSDVKGAKDRRFVES